MKTRMIISVLALFVVGATAISTADPQHNMTPSNLIDGATAPTQIPITLALRLWLDNQTHEDKITIPQSIGLSAADGAALTAFMSTHRKQLDTLVDDYNAAVEAGHSD